MVNSYILSFFATNIENCDHLGFDRKIEEHKKALKLQTGYAHKITNFSNAFSMGDCDTAGGPYSVTNCGAAGGLISTATD